MITNKSNSPFPDSFCLIRDQILEAVKPMLANKELLESISYAYNYPIAELNRTLSICNNANYWRGVIDSSLAIRNNISSLLVDYMPSTLDMLTQLQTVMIESFHNVDFVSSLNALSNTLKAFNPEKLIEVNGGYYYEEVAIDNQYIEQATQELIQMKEEETTLPQRLKSWAEKHFILVAIIGFLFTQGVDITKKAFDPELDAIATEIRAIFTLQSSAMPKVMAIRVESSKIYTDCDTESDVLCKLNYGTELTIIDSVKYWKKIEYFDEVSHTTIIGWIATQNLMECAEA